MLYLTDTDDRPQGWAAAERNVGNVGSVAEGDRLQDRQGEMEPSARDGRRAGARAAPMGLLSTAGRLLFGNDGGGNFVAYDAATGKPLWHAGLGTNTSNGPADLPARRPPVRRRRRRRCALRVYASQIDRCSADLQVRRDGRPEGLHYVRMDFSARAAKDRSFSVLHRYSRSV